MRKSLVKRVFTYLLAFLVALIVAPLAAFAADPAGVVRSGEDRNAISDPQTFIGNNDPYTGKNDFAKDAPIGTITINTSKMTIASGGQFSAINSDFEVGTTVSDEEAKQDPRIKDRNRLNNWVVYKKDITKGQSVSIDGDCFTILFPGIATLQDGSTADVLLTYSNVLLDTRSDGSGDYTKVEAPLGIATGAAVGVRNNVVTGTNATTGANVYGEVYALAIDINVKVVKDGSPVDGTVLFSTVDLDVGGNANYTKSSANNNYKESFEIKSGAVSPAYIPTYNACEITGSGSASSANGLTFASTVGHDPNDYYEGFIVLADAAEGLTLRWRGQGNGMGTTLFTGNISHGIDSGTTKGGSIKTTTTGKAPGQSGAGNELGPVHIDVPDGKDVSYLLEPEDGYELGALYIDGKTVDPDDQSTWPSGVSITKDANGNPVVTFKDNNANHSIYVSWDPIVSASSETGGSISDPGDTVVPGTPLFNADGTPQLDEDGNIKTTPGKKRYTFTPEDGYTIGTVTVNGEEVEPTYDEETGTWYYDLEVDEPKDIKVDWKKLYTVTFADGDHGKSDGKGNETEVPAGDKPAGGNGVTPSNGWQFSGKYTYKITKDDGTVEEGETDDPTSIPVTGDIVFTPIYNPVITATTGTGGAISDPGDTGVESGSSKTYTFTPEPGYTIGPVTVNGETVIPVDNGDGTWSYTLTNVTEPTTIDVQWRKLITVTYVDPATGRVIQAAVTVPEGDEGTVPEPAKPARTGYNFAGWKKTVDANGNIIFEAIWEKPKAMPSTGDTFSPALIAALAVTGLGAVAVAFKKREE